MSVSLTEAAGVVITVQRRRRLRAAPVCLDRLVIASHVPGRAHRLTCAHWKPDGTMR